MSQLLGSTVAVVSPHLDDAVFSVGAALADASAGGSDVTVVTALAGDPEGNGAATTWDLSAGFENGAEAARRRRLEDAAACDIVGARPVWLPFAYGPQRAALDEETVWHAVANAIANAETILIPGFPLENPDHHWLASLLLRRLDPACRMGLYLEQPYVRWRHLEQPSLAPELVAGDRQPDWQRVRASRAGRARKRRACRAYESQRPLLRARRTSLPVELRIALYETRAGGETIGWLEPR